MREVVKMDMALHVAQDWNLEVATWKILFGVPILIGKSHEPSFKHIIEKV